MHFAKHSRSTLPNRDMRAPGSDLMLKLESDRRRLGDIAGAERFFTEAMALRNSTPSLDKSKVSLFDMHHALRLMVLDKRAQAIEIAEAAMLRIEGDIARNGNDWAIVSPASSMALIYAHAGRIDRARQVYDKHILPWANPVIVGDAMTLNVQMSLASLRPSTVQPRKRSRRSRTCGERGAAGQAARANYRKRAGDG